MKLEDYVVWTENSVKNDTCRTKWYLGLGLAGESGEVVDQIKKEYRDAGEPSVSKDIKLELGDVIWYWVRLCKAYGFEPEDVLEANVVKLTKRQQDKASGKSK